MIQEIAPHQYDNTYHPYKIQEGDYLLVYRKRDILLKYEDEKICFPVFDNGMKEIAEKAVYLFSIDGQRFFWADHVTEEYFEAYQFERIFKMRKAQPKYKAFAAVTGAQLAEWYRSRRYCGCCGTPTEHSEKERMVQCPACHQMEYPKISPAVIIAVTNGDKILFSKYAGREYTNYALLAGFSEIGETIEEAVTREVMEEVGLKVKNIRYYKSQPWSFTDTLLIGFFAELDGDAEITLDEEELAMAEWFEREAIPVEPEDCSLTNEMMIAFKEGRV